MSQRRRLQAIAVLACVIAVSSMLSVRAARSEPARDSVVATSPGKNGPIAFRGYLDSAHTAGAIFTIAADGTEQRQVTKPGSGVIDDSADWSADGSLIVFERSGSPYAVYTVRPDGSKLTRVSPPCSAAGQSIETKCEDASSPSFHPDGKRVVYTRATGKVKTFPNGEASIEHSEIVIRDANGRSRVLVSSPPYGGDYDGAHFAPDGRRFVYVRSNSPRVKPAGAYALFVARADGRQQKQITPWSLEVGDDADWSPDGKLILLHSFSEGTKQSQIYVVRPDGTGLRALTHFKGTEVLSASFSPDGEWITFGMSGRGGAADIFVMRSNGKDIRQVTRTIRWDSAPDWGSSR